MEKLTALSWLVAHGAIFCTLLMTLSVFLVIGNSIRSDVYSSQANIDVMKLLGRRINLFCASSLYRALFMGWSGACLLVF